VYVAILQ